MLAHFTKVEVGEATARRLTERAGAAHVKVQTAELERLEHEVLISPAGPAVQQLSVDGAMVPLVHKEWAEVKTLAIGVVERRLVDGEVQAYTRDISYFSRMADYMSFARLSALETHRRGTARAGLVLGIVDGADWEQVFLDLARADAVRILDWAHAAGYVAASARAVFGQGTGESAEWLRLQLHELKHGDPEKVLAKLRGFAEDIALAGGEAAEVARTGLEYLERRREMIRYAEFTRAGYPIGSGIVESANKLVVEARLKGAGMHWERTHVDPMVALRNVACSDRWDEAWTQIAQALRAEPKHRSAARRQARRAAKRVAAEADRQLTERPGEDKEPKRTPARAKATQEARTSKQSSEPHRPAATHPWRRMPIGRATSSNPTEHTKVPEM